MARQEPHSTTVIENFSRSVAARNTSGYVVRLVRRKIIRILTRDSNTLIHHLPVVRGDYVKFRPLIARRGFTRGAAVAMFLCATHLLSGLVRFIAGWPARTSSA